MKTLQKVLAFGMVMVLLLAALPVSAASVAPILTPGNPSCLDLGYAYGMKVDPPTSGTYDFGQYGAFTFTSDGTYMNWTSTGIVVAVIVKGGNNANVFQYDPGSFGDNGLYAPINPVNGRPYGISHISVCYNFRAIEVGDAPDSTNHFVGATMYAYGDPTVPASRVVGSFPTVADPTLPGAPGMCHYVAPDGAYLGQGRSAERDADLFADPDINPIMGNVTNLMPEAGLPDLDSDDGLILPLKRSWYNGVETLIKYTITVPTSGKAGNRYINVWFDWNRDGDWGDEGVACDSGVRSLANEHTIVNEGYWMEPVASTQFEYEITPCNNPESFTDWDAVWVRITLSEEPVDETQSDGRGKGSCYAEGETEDWFFQPYDPSAVTLARFEAFSQDAGILVTWETATEMDNLGFNLYRSVTADGEYVMVNETLIPVQNPGAVFGAVYTWLDNTAMPGATYFYKLEDVDIEGNATLHGPVAATALSVNPSAVSLTAFSAGGGTGAWLPLALSALALLGGLERRRRQWASK